MFAAHVRAPRAGLPAIGHSPRGIITASRLVETP